jgi:site-specific DNA-methyltransferase (adenine-specific)
MTPVIIGGATLYNCDCMEYMRGLPDKAFELAIVDPPYGIGNWVQTTGNVRGAAVTWNDEIPNIEYFHELERVSKERIIWGANYYNSFNKNGGAIVWWKRVPAESNLSECEIASYSRLKRVAFVDIRWQNIGRGEAMIHPCQKPVKLYEWLLTNYAKPGDRILDTHLGSGSSAIACLNLGFEIVGCELDADYFAAACKRIRMATAQERLFA